MRARKRQPAHPGRILRNHHLDSKTSHERKEEDPVSKKGYWVRECLPAFIRGDADFHFRFSGRSGSLP